MADPAKADDQDAALQVVAGGGGGGGSATAADATIRSFPDEEKYPFDFEVRSRRFDGVYRWLESRVSPLRDADGQIVRWYNLIIDIDDRKLVVAARRRLLRWPLPCGSRGSLLPTAAAPHQARGTCR